MKKKIVEHRFFTDNELINKLRNEGLKITNELDLISYFESYNYQNVVNRYRKPFLINDYYKEYLPNANSQMIIDLFNFNRSMSRVIIDDLHSIEMRLSTAISLELMQIISKLHPGRTAFSALSNEERKQIFKWKKTKRINEISKYLQNNFERMKDEQDYINDSWKTWEEVPLYSLPLLWTFGIAIKLFIYLNDEIKQRIIVKYFSFLKNLELKTFISLLYCFSELRNKTSHNEPIYKYKLEISKIAHKITLTYLDLNQQETAKLIKNDILKFCDDNFYYNDNVKLFWIIKLIAKITNNPKLVNLFKQKVKKLQLDIAGCFIRNEATNKVFLPCLTAWQNICNFLGYDED